jgi:Ca2+:H+ antiporter
MPNEQTALLANGHRSSRTFGQRVLKFVKAEGEPSWAKSYQHFLVTWTNILLVFVPLSFLSHHLNWDAALRFSFSFIAILPLAKVRGRSFPPACAYDDWWLLQLLGDATEQMSTKLGQTLAGLLNATFGNAVEIIVGVAALLQGVYAHGLSTSKTDGR